MRFRSPSTRSVGASPSRSRRAARRADQSAWRSRPAAGSGMCVLAALAAEQAAHDGADARLEARVDLRGLALDAAAAAAEDGILGDTPSGLRFSRARESAHECCILGVQVHAHVAD